jgi:hypothetical protein|tara:strand:- start:329 stop:916 length:588 start_codon:yes stop_codon:yes gene_type:complete
MGNLIIKPNTGGLLKLQDEGGTDAISISTTGNTTLAGTANALGTVTAGTLGASVVNNISMIGFSGSVSGSTTYTSSVVMVFDTNVVNNGMTIMTGGDAGKIKVVTAGKYFITALAYTQHNSNSTYYAGIEIRDGGSIIAGSGATGYTADSTRLSISTHIIHAFSADDEIHISSLISGDSIFGGLNTRLSILYLGQ